MHNVTITESAQGYLAGLLEKQDCEGIGVRMFVSDPGTPKAGSCQAVRCACAPRREIMPEKGELASERRPALLHPLVRSNVPCRIRLTT